MPSGDPQRTWFPEMVDTLRMEWSCSMAWSDLIGLRDRLDEALARIRSERRIRSPIMFCRRCGKRHPAAPPRVSIRAMILAAQRFGVASEEQAKALEKGWKQYRTDHQLDLYGKHQPPPSTAEPAHGGGKGKPAGPWVRQSSPSQPSDREQVAHHRSPGDTAVYGGRDESRA